MHEEWSEVRRLLAANRYATIATATTAGTPWIAPVFFAFDEVCSLFWISNKNARHSRLIATNPRVAIALFDPDLPENGLYLEADAAILNDDTLPRALEVFNARADHEKFKIGGVEELQGDAAWRLYRAIPRRVYLLGDGRDIDGQHVDTRDEVELADSIVSSARR